MGRAALEGARMSVAEKRSSSYLPLLVGWARGLGVVLAGVRAGFENA